MSRFLVIPDVHLKPWMFEQAAAIMRDTDCEQAVCLGDLTDDWMCQNDVGLYEETMDAAVQFAREYPESLWCYGNHDLAYLWNQYDHPGYSFAAEAIVINKLEELRDTLASPEQLAIIHRVDNTLFSHAGLSREFAESQLSEQLGDIDCMIEMINGYGVEELWEVNSPIWVRPQDGTLAKGMYPPELFQVVGHTPVPEILAQDHMITTDTFSTYTNGKPIGNEEFCWVDTVNKTWGYIDR